MFICIWVYLRHYLNIRILISEFYEFKTVGPYDPSINWETGQFKGPLAHHISTALLGFLQCLNLFWLFYIFRIAYRFIVNETELQDDRSDDDETEFREEAETDRLLAQGIDRNTAAKMVANGVSSGSQIVTDGLTNRKTAAS
jgi:acyl-CoA-dependent ceramide synthase